MFKAGKLLFTRGVNDLIADNTEFTKFVLNSIRRHCSGDWGDLGPSDKAANNLAIGEGTRLFSAYEQSSLPKIWIITEADRSATTVLFPSEY